MFFWVLFIFLIIFMVGVLLAIFACNGDGVMASLVVAVILSIPVFGMWHNHASDLAKISSQQQIIEVHKDRIESLDKRLSQFNYPQKPMISMDSDSPWASIVESMTEAENKVAQAKEERAKAIRSIEARRNGPFSGVITFVGDYNQLNYNQ